MLTFADVNMSMPGLAPLVYIGDLDGGASHAFQDAASYVRFGSPLEPGGNRDIPVHIYTPEQIGTSILPLAACAEAIAACMKRGEELGHPKLAVLREGWVRADGCLIRDVLVNMDVPDLEAAIRFYEQGLGLRLARRLFENTVAEMEGAPSYTLYLLEKEPGSGALLEGNGSGAARNYARHWTPVHLDFVVEKLEPAIERLVAAGAKLETGPGDFVWGRQATFSDPFGHGICLVQWLGRGYGEIA